MTDYRERMSEILRPVSPPRELDGVYTDDQYERIVDVIKCHGPWPTITAHHFDTPEERDIPGLKHRSLLGYDAEAAEPSDPMHDTDFIKALISTYSIAPTTDWIAPTA